MASHTPGPWEYHPAPYGWDVWANTPEKFRQWIAPVTRLASPHKAIFDGSIEVDGETCAANARLIAAAPDMLAALRSAERVLTDHGYREWIGGSLDNIRAALSKATSS